MPNLSLALMISLTIRFRQGFAAGELINLGNHLAIGSPFIFQESFKSLALP